MAATTDSRSLLPPQYLQQSQLLFVANRLIELGNCSLHHRLITLAIPAKNIPETTRPAKTAVSPSSGSVCQRYPRAGPITLSQAVALKNQIATPYAINDGGESGCPIQSDMAWT